VILNVEVNPDFTTRLQGRVVDSQLRPLADVPVKVSSELTTRTSADGSFLLDLTSATSLPNTLTIDGAAVKGSVVLPKVAAELSLLLGHEFYWNTNNVIPQTIVLSPLDVAHGTQIDPTHDHTVVQELAPQQTATLMLSANSAKNGQGAAFNGILSMTEVPLTTPPVPIPDTLLPDLLFMISPADLALTKPGQLSLPNRTRFAPHVLFDLWALDPTTDR